MTPNIPPPHAGKLNNHWIIGEILDHLDDFREDYPKVDIDTLTDVLNQVKNHAADPQGLTREFLKVFQATPVYQNAYQKLDPGMQAQLKDFIRGKSAQEATTSKKFQITPSPHALHHFRFLDFFHLKAHEPRPADLPVIYEDEAQTKVMEVYGDTPFENWGLSVSNKPRYTFVPTKVLGLQNLVKFARKNNYRVRCSGYRHSWSPSFSADNEILVSLLNLKEVTTIPDPTSLLPNSPDNIKNELKSIEFVDRDVLGLPSGDQSKRFVRVGVAVTNEEFRRWSVASNAWALPVDVILVEVTIGGVNGPICHGAGRRHKTVSDYVRAVEYVDVNGDHQIITAKEPELLRGAAGCFGLLGVVTHITFELDAMTYAVIKPLKPDINLAIPPLSREDVPLALQKTFTDAQFAAAQKDFEDRAANDYYSEWFWFTYQQNAWVNTWNTTTDPTGVVEYPPDWEVWLQWIQGWLAQVVNETAFFQAIPGRWQTQLLAILAMINLPPQLGIRDTEIKTYLPDALHFRRGIQNMRVRDMEFQIPIPLVNGKPDWSIVQRAWWDVINLVYEDVESPMRLSLEMRIMGGSDLVMAPQYGNEYGTCSIEVLSLPDAVSDGEWAPFCQKVADKWMGYESEGKKLNCRPHWAKEWDKFEFGGMPATEYLKTVAYRQNIPHFREILQYIGNQHGYTLDDLKSTFSNPLWDYMIYEPSTDAEDSTEKTVPTQGGVSKENGISKQNGFSVQNEF